MTRADHGLADSRRISPQQTLPTAPHCRPLPADAGTRSLHNLSFCRNFGHASTRRKTAPGITAATPEVGTHFTYTLVFTCLCNRQTVLLQSSQGAIRERNRARYGDKDNPHVPTNFTWPIGPTVPSPVMPGIEARYMGYLGNEASVTFKNCL